MLDLAMYSLEFTSAASQDVERLRRSEPQAYAKLIRLLAELIEHPDCGTGKPERLKGNLSGLWSRRITQKHRLIYEIREREIVVIVLKSWGHYEDR